MAIRENDDLADFLGDNVVNKRHDNWLFGFAQMRLPNFLAERYAGVGRFRDDLCLALRNNGFDRNSIITARADFLVPVSCMDWFCSDKRFLSFFLQRWLCFSPVVQNNLLNLDAVDLCRLSVDLVELTIQDKMNRLASIRNEWSLRRAVGRRFEWAGGKNEAEKAALAVEEIRLYRPLPFSEPVRTLEDLLILADGAGVTDHEAFSASTAAKRKLSQKKYRESNSSKTQLNVLIDKECMKQLESLASKFGLSKSDIVRALIASEANKGGDVLKDLANWFKRDRI